MTPGTTNLYVLFHKTKLCKHSIMLNYWGIAGSHDGTKNVAKYPYLPLHAVKFVNEFKAIDDINHNKIKHRSSNIWCTSACRSVLFSQTISNFNPISLSFTAALQCCVHDQQRGTTLALPELLAELQMKPREIYYICTYFNSTFPSPWVRMLVTF